MMTRMTPSIGGGHFLCCLQVSEGDSSPGRLQPGVDLGGAVPVFAADLQVGDLVIVVIDPRLWPLKVGRQLIHRQKRFNNYAASKFSIDE